MACKRGYLSGQFPLFLLLVFFLSGVLTTAPGCGWGGIRQVKPQVFSSLPKTRQDKALDWRAKDFRVIQGKIAKAKVDLKEKTHEIGQVRKDVNLDRKDVSTLRSNFWQLRRVGATKHELKRAREDIKIAKHQSKISRQELRVRNQEKAILKSHLAVLQSHRKVFLSERELKKIKTVHQYTDWRSPSAHLEVAEFNKQLRRYEIKYSRAKFDLAKSEVTKLRQKQKLRVLHAELSHWSDRQKEPKPWTNLFTWAQPKE